MSPCHRFLASPWFHLALIILVAGFFRLWLIGRIPPGLFGDEATDGLDALDVLAGRGAIFFPANFGREGLHMWLVAGMFRLLGAATEGGPYAVTPLALRLPSVLAGILTALATYWLGRELVMAGGLETRDQEQGCRMRSPSPWSLVPLLPALYLATSYWHVHFSRFGIRGVFTPLFGALAFAAFWRAVNQATNYELRITNRRISESANDAPRTTHHAPRSTSYAWFALSGLFLGLATHFYTASRLFPFFLGGFLVLEWLIAWARRRPAEAILRRHFWGILLLYGVAAVVFAPLALYFLQHPGSFAQRASEVAATNAATPWLRMGQAALANVTQFFVPGRGDRAQFYNLPGRAVFDPLTAILALIGIGTLLWRWRRPAALFLLTWFPALLLPSFLATDRFPTLPRVLGVIPGVYFFPAAGVVAVVAALVTALGGRGAGEQGSTGAEELASARGLLVYLFPGLLAAALLLHAGLTYRDYFRVWGPSQATFDAFEGDMTAAWRWLAVNQPGGHVYLSSDIYRHPTFMLLGEQATVQSYFTQRDPNLSWFDARAALPLPLDGELATYLIGASAQPLGEAAEILAAAGVPRARVLAPDGAAALTVIEWPQGAAADVQPDGRLAPVVFTEQLALTGAAWGREADGTPRLRLTWRTAGPDPANPGGFRLEAAAGDWQGGVPFEAFRPTEWVPAGAFLTWHRLELTGDPPHTLRLRLVRVDDGQPVVRPDAPDGWHEVLLGS